MFAGPLVGIFKAASGGASDLVFDRAHLKEGTLYI